VDRGHFESTGEIAMFPAALRQNRWLLVLPALALVIGACNAGARTAVPVSTSTVQATGADPLLEGAGAALARADSYRFTMTLSGRASDSMVGMLGDASPSANSPVTVRGVITNFPDVAADLAITGLHVIEAAGFDYLDMGSTGAFDRISISETRLADQFSPATVFQVVVNQSTAGGFDKVGFETRNRVWADHYRASEPALARLGAIAAIGDATWTADVWIAGDGGYPVSMAVIGRAGDSVVYEVVFDITDVNAATNRVTAPLNVTGS
jgi:hypothetical protein